MHTITSADIKREALLAGFSFCGISRAEFLEEEAPRLERWLKENRHGQMAYMERHFDKRLDPRTLVPGTKSVVSLLYNYFPEEKHVHPEGLQFSTYAYGEDYHDVVRNKLKMLMGKLQQSFGAIEGRVFVDSAPVLEKAWAAKSGLGWIGKNANLINKSSGSFFFLAEMMIDVELEPDAPIRDYCGTCTACIDACPTDAIVTPYVVDGSKCISYFTIELKESIPSAYKDQLDTWVFGCDVCQDVCPWNRFSSPHREPAFAPNEKLLNTTRREWMEMTEEVFASLTRSSPVSRPGLAHMKENVQSAVKGKA
ncbi:MAG: tRNA epoxyqueuosine(34) reductase QueG [Flavobacteriales bacterium]|nr:tRNA epoxyqueuosine(34) reductase QueG [Flavobacteriales bacterium]